MRLDQIRARTEGGFHVVVETSRGAAFKLKLDPTLGDDGDRRVRNDRIIAVPLAFERGASVRTVNDLPGRARDELAHFSVSAVYFEGKDVRVLGWAGPEAAELLVGRSS